MHDIDYGLDGKMYDLNEGSERNEKYYCQDIGATDTDFHEDLLESDIIHESHMNAEPYNHATGHSLPSSYSFMKDIQLITYGDVDFKTERGNIIPVKSTYSKE